MLTERFELLSQLGKGGMGVVWKARDNETGEIVALKLLHAMFADDPDYVARFEREVEVAQRIDSPHVVKVLGFGRRTGVPYMAMEFIDGHSLKDILRTRGRLSWEEARNYIGQTVEGLAAAHAAGVLHRDIKPANLLVDTRGQVKVVDFGISRATDLTRLTGGMTMLGTPTYMAPEGQIDERSELYSVGVVLYELLTGEPPFLGDTMHSIIVKHMRDAPDLRRLPTEAREVVGYLLEKDPNDRPLTARRALGLLDWPQSSRLSQPPSPESQEGAIQAPKTARLNAEYEQPAEPLWKQSPRFPRSIAGRRMASAAIDYGILAGSLAIAGGRFSEPGILTALLLWAWVTTSGEALFGKSVGKLLLGLEVAVWDGSKVGWSRAFARTIVKLATVWLVVPMIVDFVEVLRSHGHKRLTDKITRTQVVRAGF